jgi:hypothetical protein
VSLVVSFVGSSKCSRIDKADDKAYDKADDKGDDKADDKADDKVSFAHAKQTVSGTMSAAQWSGHSAR